MEAAPGPADTQLPREQRDQQQLQLPGAGTSSPSTRWPGLAATRRRSAPSASWSRTPPPSAWRAAATPTIGRVWRLSCAAPPAPTSSAPSASGCTGSGAATCPPPAPSPTRCPPRSCPVTRGPDPSRSPSTSAPVFRSVYRVRLSRPSISPVLMVAGPRGPRPRPALPRPLLPPARLAAGHQGGADGAARDLPRLGPEDHVHRRHVSPAASWYDANVILSVMSPGA